MHAFVDRIVDVHGRIDIVFANAGVARGRPPLLAEGWLDDMSMTDYNALIDVNLHGVVYTVQAAAKHMKRQRSGSIVTTASTAGLRNDPYTPYSYAIAKAGVVNFTKQAAHDLARWGVRVNAIAPGPFKTNLGGGAPTSAAAEEMWRAVVPLGRMGDPSEIRGLALLLASQRRQLHDRRRLPHRRRRPPPGPVPSRRRLIPGPRHPHDHEGFYPGGGMMAV